ncbi:quinone oxidoreductase-like protein 1 [Octopus bimaculoides]|uniref:Enoyl reductase (ER) domain-containing protein n=1 Tax=Octopus bimaculoides TaxID=37653 RepID=A0A0L8FGZ3_OCTBM|nr:quinone oxidoreductase-like protein 1 [Octopus bimaculoides]XP_052830150.1 quinone oxidoreductase-like protein 1 [Octopus bimaculoides]|eukprot:XP_014789933.1 PREDICTED: quinone oxidoreductase-like protein 1 [Octopus bimaculoides]
MKAVFWQSVVNSDEETSKYVLETDLPVPSPGKNEVQVKVKTSALSPINQKVLDEVFRKNPDQKHYAVGRDVAGVITQVGEGVLTFKEGDVVVGVVPLSSINSGCAEYCIFHEYDIVKKPEMLSFEDAACGIGDCLHAYTALHYLCRLCAGDTILVMDGASTFGSITIQLALSWGAKVITTVASAEERHFLKSSIPSLAQIIDVSGHGSMLRSSVMEETGGLGVDCIIDNGVRMFTETDDIIFTKENFSRPVPHKYDLISCLGSFGRWVTSQPDLQLDPPDSRELFLRSGSLCFLFDSIWTMSYSQHGRYKHILCDAVDKLDRGLLKVNISKTIQVDEAVSNFLSISDQIFGKTIVQF